MEITKKKKSKNKKFKAKSKKNEFNLQGFSASEDGIVISPKTSPSNGKSKFPLRLKEDKIIQPKEIDCEVISFGCSNMPRKHKTITIKK